MTRFLPSLLASIACLCSLSASADVRFQVEMEPTERIYGGPGVLIFDASGPKKIFPVPATIREFNSREDYYNFLRDDMNATITSTSGMTKVDVQVITYDRAYYYEADAGFLPITDPLAMMLGGTSGYILLEGEPTCVNERLCGIDPPQPADLHLSVTPEVTMRMTAWYDEDRDCLEQSCWSLYIWEDYTVGAWVDDYPNLLEAHDRRCQACSAIPGMVGCVDIDCDWEADEVVTELSFDIEVMSVGLEDPWVDLQRTFRNWGGYTETNATMYDLTRDPDKTAWWMANVYRQDRGKASIVADFWYDGGIAHGDACMGPGCSAH